MSDVSKCAACGKGGDCLKACAACKLVKYCSATCQEAHLPNHETECKKRAAEIFHEALFKQPPPNEDCPICFLRLPLNSWEMCYQSCCGKLMCAGCICADILTRGNREWFCPFCRTPRAASDEEGIERIKKRIEAGDAIAMNTLGLRYSSGDGVPQDSNKALELWQRAAQLGCAESHYNIAEAYFNGEDVEKDFIHHWELAAMGGHVGARYNLGILEENEGDMNRALKHFMILAELGHNESLQKIQNGFSDGHVTEDEFFEKTLRAHKESTDEMQSDQRDAARQYNPRTRLHP
ncbi:hypothetical protein ACHAXR_005123 [Thalassiosira sp. AJA248-18]